MPISSNPHCPCPVGFQINGLSGFNLLEHEELQEAWRSSKIAMWVAICAMVISSTLAVVQLAFSAAQFGIVFGIWRVCFRGAFGAGDEAPGPPGPPERPGGGN